MLKPSIFREYDIRGAADTELLDADVEALGQAFGTYLQRHAGRKVNLGRDTRLSSPRLRDALMRGLKASGCEVADLGVVPTPVLYYSVFHLKADGAVMITGSHNPPEFNGFKVVSGTSTIYGDALLAAIAARRAAGFDRAADLLDGDSFRSHHARTSEGVPGRGGIRRRAGQEERAAAVQLVPRADAFRASRQRLHHARAAHRYAGLGESVQEVEQQVVENLLGERLLAGKTEAGRQLLGNRQPHGIVLRLAAAVALVGQAS